MTTMPGRKRLQHQRVLQGEVQYRLWLSAAAEAAVQEQGLRGETFEQAVNRMLLVAPAAGQGRLRPPDGNPCAADPIVAVAVRKVVEALETQSPVLQQCWAHVEALATILARWPREER